MKDLSKVLNLFFSDWQKTVRELDRELELLREDVIQPIGDVEIKFSWNPEGGRCE